VRETRRETDMCAFVCVEKSERESTEKVREFAHMYECFFCNLTVSESSFFILAIIITINTIYIFMEYLNKAVWGWELRCCVKDIMYVKLT